MAIRKPSSGPGDGEQVVRRALNFFAGHHDASDPLGGASETQFSAAIPVYRMDLENIRNKSFISEARYVGWRYLLGLAEKNQAVAIADVRENQSGQTAFSRLARGMIAQRLWDATMLADKTYRDRPEQFEFRIIDIPALQRSALWLHGDQNHNIFYPIYSGNADSSNVHEEPSFVEDVIGAASDYRTHAARGVPY